MGKFKLIIMKTLNILATVVLVVSTVLATLGLISAADMPWINDILPTFLLNMNLTETLTTSFGLGGIAGGIGTFKVASREIKRLTDLDNLKNEARIRNLEREVDARINNVMENNKDFINKVVYLMNENTEVIKEHNKHLQNLENFNLITAKRNSKLKIVSNADKELYKEYIQAVSSRKPHRAKKLNIKINEILEENELTKDIVEEQPEETAWEL